MGCWIFSGKFSQTVLLSISSISFYKEFVCCLSLPLPFLFRLTFVFISISFLWLFFCLSSTSSIKFSLEDTLPWESYNLSFISEIFLGFSGTFFLNAINSFYISFTSVFLVFELPIQSDFFIFSNAYLSIFNSVCRVVLQFFWGKLFSDTRVYTDNDGAQSTWFAVSADTMGVVLWPGVLQTEWLCWSFFVFIFVVSVCSIRLVA